MWSDYHAHISQGHVRFVVLDLQLTRDFCNFLTAEVTTELVK